MASIDALIPGDQSLMLNALETISYLEVLSRELHVMDSTATSLCMDNKLPILVFDLMVPGNISRILKGENIGTTVTA